MTPDEIADRAEQIARRLQMAAAYFRRPMVDGGSNHLQIAHAHLTELLAEASP